MGEKNNDNGLRFIVIFNNGVIQQSDGISKEYIHMKDIGVVHHIIDTLNGIQYGNNEWVPITKYNSK